jgi:ClpP class serine protease
VGIDQTTDLDEVDAEFADAVADGQHLGQEAERESCLHDGIGSSAEAVERHLLDGDA